MKLKELFNYQNRLDDILSEVRRILMTTANVVTQTQTHLISRMDPSVPCDNTVTVPKADPMPGDTQQLIAFMFQVMEEKERVYSVISDIKRSLPIDMDASISANKMRRMVLDTLNHLYRIRPSSRKFSGSGFRFNSDGNQVSFYYDIEEVTVPDFSKEAVRNAAVTLSERSDDISAKIDSMLVSTEVDFLPLYNHFDSVEDLVENFVMQQDVYDPDPDQQRYMRHAV